MSAPVVVIIAAGEGTRMRSPTPKLLHELCGLPMIDWTMGAASSAGASKIVVVDGPARKLEPALDGRAELAVQEEPLGTADAVKAASAHFGDADTVVVLNGDNPLFTGETIRALAEAHARAGAGATIATAVLEDPRSYGRVVRGPDGSVERVVETKAGGDATEAELQIREVNAGLYAFDAVLLGEALGEVRSDNAQGELYLPDVLKVIRARDRAVLAYEVEDPLETCGVNDRRELAEVRKIAQARIHDGHMLAGVTIVDPAATVIDAAVEIAADAVIEPFSSLRGRTRVGAQSVIGPLTTLTDTSVGERATVVHSFATDAEIGDDVSVGPFAYLRPGAVLRDRSKVGTFVEIKNSDIGEGAKVPHLSYVGDADVGERTNLGAGTITANYDYLRKNRTTIGARVRGGVQTALIAPVTVGDDSYTGAGSVISKDVPPGALGIARERQRNIEGYARRREERERAENAKDRGESS